MKQQEQQKHVKGIKVRKRVKGTVRGTSKKEKVLKDHILFPCFASLSPLLSSPPGSQLPSQDGSFPQKCPGPPSGLHPHSSHPSPLVSTVDMPSAPSDSDSPSIKSTCTESLSCLRDKKANKIFAHEKARSEETIPVHLLCADPWAHHFDALFTLSAILPTTF